MHLKGNQQHSELSLQLSIRMSQKPASENVLLANRKALTARQSMQALIAFARDQDDKIYNRAKRLHYGRVLAITALIVPPLYYFFYHSTVGSWRSIYHTSVLTTSIEAVQGNLREYFVPEMYIKEREIRKIQLGLKDTEEIRTLFKKQ